MKFFKQYVESFLELSDEEWQYISSLYAPKYFKKGEIIFFAGNVCTKSYYLSDGQVRSYGIDSQGKEFTWSVHINDKNNKFSPFLGDLLSLLTQQESDIFFEALNDCTVYIAEYSKIEELYTSDIKWMQLAKEVAESHFVYFTQYNRMLKRLDAKERYLAIKSSFPIFEEILPDYQLASLLDITPQSLSRIKKLLS
ncbi:Crp/Fnr family transcriptional regulator [Sulfurimonas sp.]|uniref:Crp/Fnr family transcriptional regulator n=1 Tax=Sulfurimonas sp. TaxID=2022749 RepID=UPI003D0A2EC1